MKTENPKLPKKPDAISLSLLVRARLFLEHALSHSNSASSLDRMIAIHGLDNCVEYLLRILIKHLDIESITGTNLETPELSALAGEVNKFLRTNYNISLPYLSEIKLLRQVRNLVQHAIVDPQPDLERHSQITERFFDKILNSIFGINKEELRISTLIVNDDVKKHLKLAEEYLDQKEYLKSIVASRDAFENALFYKKKNSEFKFAAAPALTEAKKNNEKTYWFFLRITNEFELLRLGVDIEKYNRFLDYVRHIPGEYKADKSTGWVYMQRPWNKDDAQFCYSFASNMIMKWQSLEMQPLYTPKVDKSYSFKEKIGEIDLSSKLENACYYELDFYSNEVMFLIYVDQDRKKKLDDICLEHEYEYITEGYENGLLVDKNKRKVKILNLNLKLVTNNPERWEAIFWLIILPFTSYRETYKDGKLIEKTPSINTAKVSELRKINETVIDKNLALKVVSLRKAIGKICSKEDLRKIKNITDEQIDWLANNTII